MGSRVLISCFEAVILYFDTVFNSTIFLLELCVILGEKYTLNYYRF